MSPEIKEINRESNHQLDEKTLKTDDWNKNNPGIRPGIDCPRCHSAKIKYNGLLNLVCDHCGWTETGAFT